VQRGQLAPGGDAKDGAVGPAPAGSGKQINTAAFSADFNIASPSSAVLFYNWPTEVKEAASTNAQIRITFFIGRGARVEFAFLPSVACRPQPPLVALVLWASVQIELLSQVLIRCNSVARVCGWCEKLALAFSA